MIDYLIDFFIDFIARSGWVFFPLFMLGLLSWYLVISIYSQINTFQKNLQDFLDDGKNHSSEKNIYTYIMEKFFSDTQRGFGPSSEYTKTVGVGNTSDDFEEWIHRLLKGVHRDIHTVLSLAGVAPLLGLLGTVTGMMNTFEVISLYGNSNPILMADGISEAMLTTQIGLLIAFPLLLVVLGLRYRLNHFRNRLMKEFITYSKDKVS